MGGVAIFVKNDFQDAVKVIPNTNKDSIWIKINKSNSNPQEDTYIGTYYISPIHKRNKNKDDLFTVLNEDIYKFKGRGNIFIQGDLNGRIGQNNDFITHDKFDEIFGITNNYYLPTRNSEDIVVNTRGKELLDFCKTNEYIVLNGRKTGDIFGNYTSHQWNGSSVVDYVITTYTNYDKILNFSVGEYIYSKYNGYNFI